MQGLFQSVRVIAWQKVICGARVTVWQEGVCRATREREF